MKKRGHHPDYIFIACIWLLVVFGLVMLSSASSDLGKIKFNDTYYYVKHQIFYGLSLGLLGFLITSFVYYRHLKKIAVPLLLFGVISLVLVFTPLGVKHAGANRWLNLGAFSFQPAEFLKFAFIIYLAAWLSEKREGQSRQIDFLPGFLPFVLMSGLIALLIVIQPSTTTVFIIMISAILTYFVSGAKLYYILSALILGVVVFALIIALTPYRFERIITYLKLSSSNSVNVQKEGYQINQSLIAIGSGGLTGVGFGRSTAKFKSLPEPIGDSISAVIGEELGFLGIIGLLTLYALAFVRGFILSLNSRDQFARLVTVGFISVIAIQVFIHIAANSGFIPLTGVPLPFISFGGTSLVIFLTMAGVIVNISKYT